MTAIRIMTYSIQGCRGPDGRVDPSRILPVIAEGAADIVALQDVDGAGSGQLEYLAGRLGMRGFGTSGTLGFLSYYPLRGIQEYRLGEKGRCLRADADIQGQRLHLFNIRLEPSPGRRRQIEDLLGSQLLGSPSLCCPILVLGDFADWFWGRGNLGLSLNLRRASRPLLNATYPATFPLVARDRAYFRGELEIGDVRVVRNAGARQASTHLPLLMTVQVRDPRCYLRLEKLARNRMEIAPG